MIPLPITVEDYAKHFPPASDYLILKRMANKDAFIGRILKPESVQRGQNVNTTVAEILAISDYQSIDPAVELMKSQLRDKKYVCYPLHCAGEISLMEEFRLPPDDAGMLVSIHVKDVFQIPYQFDELMQRFKDHQLTQNDSEIESETIPGVVSIIDIERKKLIESR